MIDMEFHLDNDYSILLEDPDPQNEEESNQPPKAAPEDGTREAMEKNWWRLEYYQRFFDVKSSDVLNRIEAIVMVLSSTDINPSLSENPDLYGPFWICITLAIEIGLMSNVAHYFFYYGGRNWRQTVRTVYQVAVLLFLYCWCFPTLLWIGFEWNPISTHKFRLMELWCVYGYAISILVPAATLWALPLIWLRWAFVTLAVILSGIYICRHLKKVLSSLDPKTYYALQAMFFTLNALIASSFVFLFFPHKFHDDADGNLSNWSGKTTEMLLSQDIFPASKIAVQSLNFAGNSSFYNSSTI